MAKVRIVNKGKFIRSLILFSILFGLVFSFTVNAVSNKTVDKNELTEEEQEYLVQFEQVEIFVYRDQTAWDIQKELAPNSDIRKLLYYDSILNEKNMEKIKSGDTLIFLKERD